MVEHFLRFENEVSVNENQRLEDILKGMGDEDELIISMDSNEIENSDYLFNLLRDHGFEVLPKGGHEDQQYHIVAQRKKKN